MTDKIGKVATDIEVTATEEKPKQVINMKYRGKTTSIGELSKLLENDQYCVQRLIPKEDRPKINNFSSCKLPQFFIVEKIEDGPNNSKHVHYATPLMKDPTSFKRSSTFAPNDMPVKILSGTVGKTKAENFEKHRTANIDKYVSNIGMSVGTDPEIFIADNKGNIIPAFTFLPTQEKTNILSASNAKVFNDGFQAEWNTVAGHCLAYLCDSVQRGMKTVYDEAQKKHKGSRLSNTTVIEVDKDYLHKITDEQAALGCAPSLNVYGLKGDINISGREVPFRCAGGHQHYGVGKLKEESVIECVKSLDNILAVSCVSLFEEYDNPIRRKYYGLPGEYRLPTHGIEYRTLSNAWLIHPVLMHLTFDLGRKALSFGFNGLRKYWKGSEEETIEIVTNCDAKKAREVMERNKPIITALLRSAYVDGYDEAYSVFYKGVNAVIADPDNFVKNWRLDGTWVTHSNSPNSHWATAKATIAKGKKL